MSNESKTPWTPTPWGKAIEKDDAGLGDYMRVISELEASRQASAMLAEALHEALLAREQQYIEKSAADADPLIHKMRAALLAAGYED